MQYTTGRQVGELNRGQRMNVVAGG